MTAAPVPDAAYAEVRSILEAALRLPAGDRIGFLKGAILQTPTGPVRTLLELNAEMLISQRIDLVVSAPRPPQHLVEAPRGMTRYEVITLVLLVLGLIATYQTGWWQRTPPVEFGPPQPRDTLPHAPTDKPRT